MGHCSLLILYFYQSINIHILSIPPGGPEVRETRGTGGGLVERSGTGSDNPLIQKFIRNTHETSHDDVIFFSAYI